MSWGQGQGPGPCVQRGLTSGSGWNESQCSQGPCDLPRPWGRTAAASPQAQDFEASASAGSSPPGAVAPDLGWRLFGVDAGGAAHTACLVLRSAETLVGGQAGVGGRASAGLGGGARARPKHAARPHVSYDTYRQVWGLGADIVGHEWHPRRQQLCVQEV